MHNCSLFLRFNTLFCVDFIHLIKPNTKQQKKNEKDENISELKQCFNSHIVWENLERNFFVGNLCIHTTFNYWLKGLIPFNPASDPEK